jgi:hypothetical protein
MIPNVARQALHFRRAFPWASFPHPIVRPPQDRQAIPSTVAAEVWGVSFTVSTISNGYP